MTVSVGSGFRLFVPDAMIGFRLLFSGENNVCCLVGKFHGLALFLFHFLTDAFYFGFAHLMEVNGITEIVQAEERYQSQRVFLHGVDTSGIVE